VFNRLYAKEVLVTGANPGSKVALAEAYGVEIWDEDTFIEALAKEEEEEEEEEEVKKHVKKKKKSSPACSGPRWEWEDDDGNWNQYAKEDGELIEGSYQTEEPSFVTKDFSWNLKHQTLYKVDFENMIQINVESEVERNIRRLGPKTKKSKSKEDVKLEDSVHSRWEWKDDDGNWCPFADEDNDLLEERYKSGPKGIFSTTEFSFNKTHNTVYVVNFKKGTQRNVETNSVRPIRRAAVSEYSSSSSGKSSGKKGGKIAWEWWNDDGDWAEFAEEDAKMIEEAYRSNTSPFVTRNLTFNKIHKSLYIFDFIVMTQVNSDSGTSRKMRRRGTKITKSGHDKAEDDGYADVLDSEDWGASVKVKSSAEAPIFSPSISTAEVKKQQLLGAQSLRGRKGKKVDYGPAVSKDKHGRKCFDEMLENEKRFCGEWVVFYHSYSAAALLYEVQAAVAAVLFRFKSQFAALPRLLWKPFNDIPNAKAMLKEFPTWPDRDHNPRFRAVGLCGTSSLLAHDSEAPPKSVFLMGYSVGSIGGILEKLLKACGVPGSHVKKLAKRVIKLAEKHGLDCCGVGGKMCKSGRAGHMLQIFIRRELVDKYVYPSFPYGVPDKKRDPLGRYLSKNGQKSGQVRLTVNPDVFLRASCVRMFVFSADPTFHKMRADFQEALQEELDEILKNDKTRVKAAKGIFGGKLPSWWSSDDQSEASKMTKKRYLMPDFD